MISHRFRSCMAVRRLRSTSRAAGSSRPGSFSACPCVLPRPASLRTPVDWRPDEHLRPQLVHDRRPQRLPGRGGLLPLRRPELVLLDRTGRADRRVPGRTALLGAPGRLPGGHLQPALRHLRPDRRSARHDGPHALHLRRPALRGRPPGARARQEDVDLRRALRRLVPRLAAPASASRASRRSTSTSTSGCAPGGGRSWSCPARCATASTAARASSSPIPA